jgi:energy-coupling factor transporter transmembrane protein EcfT
MISSSSIYWILMLDNIRIVLWILISISIVIMGAYASQYAEKKVEETPTCIALVVSCSFMILIISSVSLMLCPTTKQATIIYATPKILTEKNVTEFTGETKELYNLGKQYIKEALIKKEEDK